MLPFLEAFKSQYKYKRCCQSRGSRFDGAGVFLKTGLSWPGAWLIVGCTRIVLPGLHLHLPQLPLSHVPAITPEILLQWSVAVNAACSSNWSRCAAYLLCKKPASAFESLDALRGEGGGSKGSCAVLHKYIWLPDPFSQHQPCFSSTSFSSFLCTGIYLYMNWKNFLLVRATIIQRICLGFNNINNILLQKCQSALVSDWPNRRQQAAQSGK